MPPAVQTELHEQQPELVAIGQARIGMPLTDFLEETWAALEAGDQDEIIVGSARERWTNLEDGRKKGFKEMEALFRRT
jgi:hypothetical protein